MLLLMPLIVSFSINKHTRRVELGESHSRLTMPGLGKVDLIEIQECYRRNFQVKHIWRSWTYDIFCFKLNDTSKQQNRNFKALLLKIICYEVKNTLLVI